VYEHTFEEGEREKNTMKIMRGLVTTVLAGLLVASAANADDHGMERWSDHHPEASKALGLWVKNHPDAAARFFDWDGHHPERSQAFVSWTIDHPSERIGKYIHEHPDEPFLDEIMKTHRDATEGFMSWCRDHPEAARDLMTHSRGLEWAGHHLYKEYWNMESK
jgi:hypothetical protein